MAKQNIASRITETERSLIEIEAQHRLLDELEAAGKIITQERLEELIESRICQPLRKTVARIEALQKKYAGRG